MDVYKSPKADVSDNKKEFAPVKAVLLGLLVAIIVSSVASFIEVIIYVLFLDLDITQANLEAELSNNIFFLVTDTLITGLIFFWAGRIVGNRTAGKELLYGLVVASLSFIIMLPLFITSNAFSVWPLWYNLSAFILLFIGTMVGSISTKYNR